MQDLNIQIDSTSAHTLTHWASVRRTLECALKHLERKRGLMPSDLDPDNPQPVPGDELDELDENIWEINELLKPLEDAHFAVREGVRMAGKQQPKDPDSFEQSFQDTRKVFDDLVSEFSKQQPK